jgi:hypothetical protein
LIKVLTYLTTNNGNGWQDALALTTPRLENKNVQYAYFTPKSPKGDFIAEKKSPLKGRAVSF